jgi:hypothetical protein
MCPSYRFHDWDHALERHGNVLLSGEGAVALYGGIPPHSTFAIGIHPPVAQDQNLGAGVADDFQYVLLVFIKYHSSDVCHTFYKLPVLCILPLPDAHPV